MYNKGLQPGEFTFSATNGKTKPFIRSHGLVFTELVITVVKNVCYEWNSGQSSHFKVFSVSIREKTNVHLLETRLFKRTEGGYKWGWHKRTTGCLVNVGQANESNAALVYKSHFIYESCLPSY